MGENAAATLEPYGAHLQALRAALSLTQAQLAPKLGCSTITLKRWEAGTLKPAPPQSRNSPD